MAEIKVTTTNINSSITVRIASRIDKTEETLACSRKNQVSPMLVTTIDTAAREG